MTKRVNHFRWSWECCNIFTCFVIYHKDSRPKPASDRVLTPSRLRARISSPLATTREQRPYRAPNRNVTYVIRGSRSWSHQEPHPSKQAGANIPPPSAIWPRARAMGQGYPLTGPSPGATPPIYPSSLPLACGNRLSNIFPKSHGFFFVDVFSRSRVFIMNRQSES
jgi:hypothetical protein